MEKVLNHLSETEKKLVALCIEFEGSISLSKTKKHRYIQFRVYNTRRVLLEQFQRIIRCGQIGKACKNESFGRKQMYAWRLNGSANRIYSLERNPHIALRLYQELEPFLLTKKLKEVE